MEVYEDRVKALRNNADHYMTVPGEAGLVHLLTDAADAIEELRREKAKIENSGKLLAAAFDRLKKAHRWIPVEEKLPECGEEVLCWIATGYCMTGCYNPDTKLWVPDAEWATRDVTHWLPSPEPPEEKE